MGWKDTCVGIGLGFREKLFNILFDISPNFIARANKANDFLLFFQFVTAFECFSPKRGSRRRPAGAAALLGLELCKSDITIDFYNIVS